MIWPLISSGLVGVVGLLFGLWQRSRAQGFKEKADAFSSQLAQETANHADTVRRYENLVSNMRAEIQKLQKDLDANVPPDKLAERLNDILGWRLRSQTSETPAPASGVSNSTAPGNEPSPG
jgi:hypothetical protein